MAKTRRITADEVRTLSDALYQSMALTQAIETVANEEALHTSIPSLCEVLRKSLCQTIDHAELNFERKVTAA